MMAVLASVGETGSQIHSSRGFAHATFLIANGDNFITHGKENLVLNGNNIFQAA